MPATLVLRLTGGASNANPDLSLGGVSSANNLSSTALNNLFDDVSPSEALAGSIEYRAIDAFNSGDAVAAGATLWMSAETTNTKSSVDVGVVTSPIDDTESIADEVTAPVGAGIAFAHYNSASKLSLPDIAANSYCRVWIKRIIVAGAINSANDIGTLSVQYA